MAASGFTPILIYASGTATNVPLAANLTSSASGAELALNYADGKLYFKNSSGVVTLLAGSGGGGPAAGSNTQLQFNSSGVFGASSSLTWSGTVLSTTGLTATGAILHNTTTNNQSYTTTGAGAITISSGTTGTIDGMNIGATTAGTGRFSSITNTGLTSGRVVYSTTGGLETDSANLTFNGTTLTANTLNLTNVLGTAYGGTGLASFTANGVVYASSTSALVAGSSLTFDGANLGVGTASPVIYPNFSSITAQGTNGGTFNMRNGTATVQFAIETSSTSTVIKTVTSEPLTFGAGNAEYMRIAVASGGVGAVGIGYTSLTSVGNNGLAVLGNVGIGTTSPAAKLNVVGTGQTFAIYGGGTSSLFQTFNTTGGNYYIGISSSTGGGLLGGASAYSMCLVTESARDMIFGTNNTERMRIDSSGNLLVGKTDVTVTTNGVTIGAANYVASSRNNDTAGFFTRSGTDGSAVVFYKDTTVVGSISVTGTLTSYNVTSDQRLKENIVDASEFGSVIDSLQVRSFDWKTDQTHQRAGFVAQELVTVAPEAVHQPADPEEMMAVDYSKLVPMLVKEIQSLRKRLKALESKEIS